MDKMRKNKLEDFVKVNRDAFDFREPSPEVWNRISGNFQSPKVVSFRTYLLRVAVVLAIISIGSVAVWKAGLLSSGPDNGADPELVALMETEAYYSGQVDKKLEEIRKCYVTIPELKDEVEADLNELEEMYRVLKDELGENISNRSVIEAMIENNRYRLKLCDDVLEQIKC
jgi:hypothetical protein